MRKLYFRLSRKKSKKGAINSTVEEMEQITDTKKPTGNVG